MIGSYPRERTKPRSIEYVGPSRAVSNGPAGRVYARFLELPPALVIAVLWLTGVVVLAACGLALYLAGTALM
jgi:hypothetical protein